MSNTRPDPEYPVVSKSMTANSLDIIKLLVFCLDLIEPGFIYSISISYLFKSPIIPGSENRAFLIRFVSGSME